MTASLLCQQLGITHPIIKAPMAGGIDQPELVAAVSNAGGMGFIGGAYLSPEQLATDCQQVRQLTNLPFGINLFVPDRLPALPDTADTAVAALAPLHQQLQLPPPELPKDPTLPFDALFEVALRSGAKAISFTFGLLPEEAMKQAQQEGIYLIGTATSVEEAQQLEAAGIDAVVAQGSEAGGHQGSFQPESAMIGTLSLVPAIAAAVQLPIIAAGGIMDGRGIKAALTLGASAAQLGTAFIPCPESGAATCWKQAILNSPTDQTRLTNVFSGRYARGLINSTMEQLEASAQEAKEAILPFPWQNSLTKALRGTGAQNNDAAYLSLWAGQGYRLAREMPAACLMQALIEEME